MTIAEKITEMWRIRQDIRQTLIEMGIPIESDLPFRLYASKIRQLQGGSGSGCGGIASNNTSPVPDIPVIGTGAIMSLSPAFIGRKIIDDSELVIQPRAESSIPVQATGLLLEALPPITKYPYAKITPQIKAFNFQ